MNVEDKKIIYKAFIEGSLQVQAVSKDKRVEWKTVVDAVQHDVSMKDQYKICANNGQVQCTTTGDHSLYKNKEHEIEELFVREAVVGNNLALVKDGQVVDGTINSISKVPSQQFMYDLSVEDYHNFVLLSGLVAHNTFRPPASEKFVQGQTQVFGFIWEDEELYEYLTFAVDDFNGRPPTTGIDLNDVMTSATRWRTTILTRAAFYACQAVALNWISSEFSYSISGVSLDLEKSSKYQSMQESLDATFDKMVESNKSSIKLIKGLKQARYGTGIQSALGPLSRPGVQSRRNLLGAGYGAGA